MSEPAGHRQAVLRSTRPSRINSKFFRLIPGGKGMSEYQPFPMQRVIHASKALYRVACLGRQVGKSELASAEAAFELCTNANSEGWVVAPVHKQTKVIYLRTVEKVIAALEKPEFAHLKANVRRSDLEIEVEHYDRDWRASGAKKLGTAKFAGRSAAKLDNLVGATLTYLIIDEAAVVQQEAWEVALEPMLSTTQGWVLFISTPRGFNWFYEIYERGRSTAPEDVAWESFNAPSWDANPVVPRTYYQKKKLEKPDLEFRQEYGAEFVSNSGSVFQGIDGCPKMAVDADLSDYQRERLISLSYNPKHAYVVGADFGRLQDYTVYTVMDTTSRQMVASYRFDYVDWDRQLAELKRVSDEYGGALVVGDNNGVGDYIQLECAKLGIPFEGLKFTGTEVKTQTINHLAIGLEQGYLAIQDDPSLYKELRLYKYTRTESGQLKMAAEGRNHDDRVVSLALAYSKCEHVGQAEGLTPEETSMMKRLESDLDNLREIASRGDSNVLGIEVLGDYGAMDALSDLSALNRSLMN
ncbi:hypothetical protein Dxin01_00190 [Deinococcus xinjiangensis]|uniref:Terminase-like family protein n=1 Tax=Deinococcus xinjiangensis TaxID=457454 RepID=A0ABP9V5B0_9DEIO